MENGNAKSGKPEPSPRSRSSVTHVVVACVLAAVISVVATRLLFGRFYRLEVLAGWLITTVNASIFSFSSRKAIRNAPAGFFVWAILVNGLRFVGMIAIILTFWLLSLGHLGSFLLSVVIGYFVTMTAEIWSLYTLPLERTLKHAAPPPPDERR